MDRDCSFEFELRPGENRFTVGIPSGIDVHGRVLDTLGRPVAGASVACFSWPRLIRLPIARSDAQGAFSIVAVPEPSFLVALHDELAPSDPKPVRRSDPGDSIELQLGPPGAFLIGSVRSAGGEPVPGAEMILQPFEGPEPPENMLETPSIGLVLASGGDGGLRSYALPCGWWSAKAMTRRQGTCAALLEARLPGAVEREFRLEAGASIRGTICEQGGRPIAWASLDVRDCGLDFRESRADERGSFVVDDLAPGSLSLLASAPGFLPRELRLEPDDRRHPLRIFLDPGAGLRGRILTANGAPLAEWTVGAAPHTGPAELWTTAVRTTADGRFSLDVPPGDYRLEARDPRSRFSSVLVLALSARPDPSQMTDYFVSSADLDLGEVRGRLVGSDASTLANAGARLLPAGSSVARGPRLVDERGFFAFEGLRRGEYELVAEAPGCEERRFGPYLLGPGERRDLGALRLDPHR